MLLTMRITAIMLLATALQVSARGLGQITLSEKKAPLEKVLNAVKQQSGYDLFYDEVLVRKEGRPVDIDVKNVSVERALELIFSDQVLGYTIAGKIISVKAKDEKTAVSAAAATAPVNDIHGRVTDSLGNPMAGASVTVKGTKRGVETDANGMFDLKGVGEGAVLVVTFTGYQAREYRTRAGQAMVIVLSKSNSPLDEIQVIAYGTTSKRFSTGNVTTVQSADIEKQPVTNALLALEARVPGLFITQNTGLPNAGVTVRIQGQNSIAGGNDPLYVIDGVPYISQLLPTINGILQNSGGFGVTGTGNPLSFIDPAEIESISVLKDADATAIYGSRAANGAILITTKKGKTGKTKVDVVLQNGWGKVGRKMQLLTTPQYLQLRREGKANDNVPILSTDYDFNGVWDTTRYTDWQKVLIGGALQNTRMRRQIFPAGTP